MFGRTFAEKMSKVNPIFQLHMDVHQQRISEHENHRSVSVISSELGDLLLNADRKLALSAPAGASAVCRASCIESTRGRVWGRLCVHGGPSKKLCMLKTKGRHDWARVLLRLAGVAEYEMEEKGAVS